jgi:hypothetical protein
MTSYSRVSTMLVAIVVAVLASACKAGPTSRSSPGASTGPSAPPTAALGAKPQAMPLGEVAIGLKAGTYAFWFPLLDAPGKRFPKVAITVGDGWWSYKGFAVQSLVGTPRQLGVSFWNVGDVYANGCHWLGPMIHPGPTVEELAAVLAARPVRNATAPVGVSLGGYHGKYLEWSVPVDIHFSDCDKDPGGTDSFFESWTGTMLWNAPFNPSGTTDRYQLGPGQVDRLWILDVMGRRLVIDATYLPSSTDQDRAEMAKVVDSITFVP